MKNKLLFPAFLMFVLFMQSIIFAQLQPPTNLTATEIVSMGHSVVKLEWQGYNEMERYNVYKKPGAINDPGDFLRIANHIMHRSFIDNMVIPDSTYSYYVTAVDQFNESDPSEMVEITLNGINQEIAVITGMLFNEQNNEPIIHGRVRFIEENTFHGPEVFTNDQGEFVVHLLPGDYYMKSSAMEFKTEYYDNVQTIELATLVMVNDGDSLNFNIGLTPDGGFQGLAIVTGTLYNDQNNEPIVNGKIKFTEENSCHGPVVFTNQQGEFIAQLMPGNYYMRSSAMNFIPEFYDNVPTLELATLITVVEGDSIDFSIGLAPVIPPVMYTLSGNVSDSAGNPVPSRIKITPVRMNSYFHRHHQQHWTVTDSFGNYSIPVKEGDTVVVFCKPFNHDFMPEYFEDKQTFAEADRIPITGNITGIDFVVEPAPVFNNGISGVVQNESNEGVDAHVAAFRLGGGNHMKKYRTDTDSLGNYSISNMIPGEYILLAIPHDEYIPTFFRYDAQPTLNWHEADSVLIETTGVVQGIDFIVHPFTMNGYAKLTGTVKDNANNVITGAVIFALDLNNNIVDYAISNSDGEFVIKGFEPGTYKIFGDKFGYGLHQSFIIALDYVANQSQAVDLLLIPENVTSAEQDIIADGFALEQNYPNPFNPNTVISYQIPVSSKVTLKIYDVLGNDVATLVNSEKAAGSYEITWNAESVPSGVYFYTISAGQFSETKKMMLMK